METSCLNMDMCKFESSGKTKIRAQWPGSSKVCCKQRAINTINTLRRSDMRVGSYNIKFMDVVVFAVGQFWFARFKMG